MIVTPILDAARHLALDLGWPVLPVRPHGKTPLTAHGVKDATVDERTILHWADKWPDMNLGVATGAPGPQVLDIDRPGDVPVSMIDRLFAANPPQVTTSRGVHIYYAGTPAGTVTLEYGELRGRGSYVLVPPSTHPDGTVYAWKIEPPAFWAPGAAPALNGHTIGTGTAPIVDRVTHGERHAYLTDLAVRTVKGGLVDAKAVEDVLRAAYDRVCDKDPPARGDEFSSLAKWATGTRIAARESTRGPGMQIADRQRDARAVIDAAGGWAPRHVTRVVRDGVRLTDMMWLELDDGTMFDFPHQGEITSRLWQRTVTSHTGGRAEPAPMKEPELAALFQALCIAAGVVGKSLSEADELTDHLAGLLGICEPLMGHTLEDAVGRYRLIAVLKARVPWDPGDRQSIQQPPLVVDRETGAELLRAGDVWSWFRHRGAGLTGREFPGRMTMIGLRKIRLSGREARVEPGVRRATNTALFYELPKQKEDDMTDQPVAPEPSEPDPEAPAPSAIPGQTEIPVDPPDDAPADPGGEEAAE